jgi:hypothetical protein
MAASFVGGDAGVIPLTVDVVAPGRPTGRNRPTWAFSGRNSYQPQLCIAIKYCVAL